LDVGDGDVLALHAEADEEIEAGQSSGAGTRSGELGLGDVLADQLEAVEHGRGDDDRGAVLIVVEHRNAHALAEQALDDEALRGLDVLEVDAAKRRLERSDDL